MESASKPASVLRAQWSALFAPAERTLPAMLTRQANDMRTGRWSAPATRHGAMPTPATPRPLRRRIARRRHQGRRPVAVICSNRIEFLEILFGCAWLGAVAVPINVASRGPQLQHILSNCGARLLVLEDAMPTISRCWTRAGSRRSDLADRSERRSGFGNAAVTPMPRGGERIAAAAVRPDDLGLILYTSGTTGPSKGVCCPHAQYFWWAVNTASLLQLRDGDVLCTSLPLFHTNALKHLLPGAAHGRLGALREAVFRLRFFPSLVQSRATVTYLLGAMVPILLSRPVSPGGNRTSGQHCARARRAGAVSRRVHAAHRHPPARRLGLDRNQCRSRHDDRAPAARIDGPVFEGFDARVVDDRDQDVADGTAGELIVRADEPLAFAHEYFGAPEKTAEAWRDRLVPHRRSRRAPERRLFPVRRPAQGCDPPARREHFVLRGRAGAAQPSRRSPTPRRFRSARACGGRGDGGVILHPGRTLDEAELIAFCEPRLPYFAVPRYLEFVSELPSTESGKVQKYKLRERGVTDKTWDRVLGPRLTEQSAHDF
jgi:crotonobetaine/carnitine-CoA ligase